MENKNQPNNPLQTLRDQLPNRQAGDKPANDVLNAENSGPNAESQFVHSTHEELRKGDLNEEQQEAARENSNSTMPDDERLTEKD